jgi:hypothetical protein
MSMSDETKEPSGCLSCNNEPVRAFLISKGVDPARFVQCPPPRHNRSDVIAPCGEC